MSQPKHVWKQVYCPECNRKMGENRLEKHLWYMHNVNVEIIPRKLENDKA
jgi:hypothetical protein